MLLAHTCLLIALLCGTASPIHTTTLSVYATELAKHRNSPSLVAYVEKKAREMGVAMPKIHYIPGVFNAAAGGILKNELFIGSTLIDGLTKNELNGVICHELSHLRRQHSWQQIGICAIFATPPILALFSFTRFLIPAFASRCYEWQADKDALKFCEDKKAYAQALKKLKAAGDSSFSLYHSHPSIDARIRHAEQAARRHRS